MFVQESFLEHKIMHDTLDELDETLSLCDLPLYGDQSVEDWEEDLSLESQGSTSISSSEEHDDYFEFFSHELTRSTTHFPPENIVFCGKIIPYKTPSPWSSIPSKEVDMEQPTIIEKKPSWSLFKWKFTSTKGSKNSNKGTTAPMQEDQHHQTSKKRYNTNKQGKGYDSTLHKISILTSSSSGKAKWFLFLTGISRFSSKIEVRDIKNRQSRRHSPSPPPSPAEAGEPGQGSSSRLWEVVRVLSCGGNQNPDSMVVPSIICNQLEGR